MRLLNFMDLDFISLDCLDVANKFYWGVYLSAAFPAALSVLNCVTYSFRLASEVALGYAAEEGVWYGNEAADPAAPEKRKPKRSFSFGRRPAH